MKMHIQSILALTFSLTLAGCQEFLNLQESDVMIVPEGEMAFCIDTEDVNGAPLTRGMVPGEVYTSVASLQLICFDESGYYLGLRPATPIPTGEQSLTGTFSGYVPVSTARIHFVANASLDLSEFAVGTAEKVIMASEALSTKYTDAPTACFWGYHKESSASAMRGWLQASNPNTVKLLRDRARIKLTVDNSLFSGSWLNDSAGTGKKVTSIRWGVNNGRERGYLAPYFSPYNTGKDNPWEGYDAANATITLHEYEDCKRYKLTSVNLDSFVPTANNYQYVFDDSNITTSSKNDRIVIVLEVNYENNAGGGGDTKYLLAQLRNGSGGDQGDMTPIIRNNTYALDITNLAHDGYHSFDDAVKLDADDFANAPDDVDITVPFVTDGKHILNLLSPKPVVVARTAGQVFNVEFQYKKAPDSNDPNATNETHPVASDFRIYWEENINDGWTSTNDLTIGEDLTRTSVDGDYSNWRFTAKIGTIGSNYAFKDYLVIRHKKSGLTRYIHFYAVDHFKYREEPILEQVKTNSTTPYIGPSGDDPKRPVFKLTLKLSQSLEDDLFPITVRLASSTLQPYGDKTTSYTARLSGGFGVLNAPTTRALDGTLLDTSNSSTDWYYESVNWNFWYGYTLNEYPDNGEVVIYLKDIRDFYSQASNQNVGLYLDIENFGWETEWGTPVYGRSVANGVLYPNYPYEEGEVAGIYRVGPSANKYRATITGCESGATYTLSDLELNGNVEGSDAGWLSESIIASANGTLDFKFTVTANTAGERSANIVFTKVGDNTKKTKVTVIQESGMATSLRLKADNTNVPGNTKEVNLTVFSNAVWDLVADHGGSFSQDSGSSTGDFGTPVKFYMPVNYTTSEVSYTITATKRGTNETATVVITQRGYSRTSTGTDTFQATSFNEGTPASYTSSHNIQSVFSTISQILGVRVFMIETYRMDVPDGGTLTVTSTNVTRRLTGASFDYYVFGSAHAPAATDVSTGTVTRLTSDYIDNWTGDANTVVFTFHSTDPQDPVAIESFTVTYTQYYYE